jgi:ABC-type branched-subunit amino acid transport system ATPase component
VQFGVVKAVSGVSFEINPGEVVGLIGPNGAGKTTLIDAIAGNVRLQSGTVALGDRRIDHFSPSKRSRAGVTRSFQSLELFEDVSVEDNLKVASEGHDWSAFVTDIVRPGQAPLSPAALAAVREFGLEQHLNELPSELPHGIRRLVGIARSVAMLPSILMLDEPAAGLDENESRELGTLIRTLAEDWGMGILLVEHDVSLVMSVCDRVHAISFGETIAEGVPAEVRTSPTVVAAYLGE